MADLQFKVLRNCKTAFEMAGHGAPLLMLHGGEADRRMFQDAIAHLQNTFLTITYDQRGCGETQVNDELDYGLGDLADDAADLIASLGYEKMHVLGQSAGGMVAQMLALRWPGRVDKLILQATAPLTSAKQVFEDERMRETMKAMAERGPAAIAGLFSTPSYVAEHPEILDVLATRRGSRSPEDFGRRMLALKTFASVDLGNITAPTLVLCPEHDQIIPRALSEEMSKAIPNATFQVYPNAGHIGIMQFPEGFSKTITKFLTA